LAREAGAQVAAAADLIGLAAQAAPGVGPVAAASVVVLGPAAVVVVVLSVLVVPVPEVAEGCCGPPALPGW
jgi:hypothetical protein